MNIILQTACVDASLLNGKSEIPNKTLANIINSLLLNSILQEVILVLTLSAPHMDFPAELIIGSVMIFLTSYEMDQQHNANT